MSFYDLGSIYVSAVAILMAALLCVSLFFTGQYTIQQEWTRCRAATTADICERIVFKAKP